jgi:hypothetical protein
LIQEPDNNNKIVNRTMISLAACHPERSEGSAL